MLLALESGVDVRGCKIYRLRIAKNIMYGVQSTEVISILFHLIV